MLFKGKQSLLYPGIIFLLFIVVATVIAYRTSQTLQIQLDQTLVEHLRKQELFEAQVRLLQERFILLRDIVSTEDPFDKDEFVQQHANVASKFIALRLELKEMNLTRREQDLLVSQEEKTQEGYLLQVDLIQRSIEETKPEHYREVLEVVKPLQDEVLEEMLLYSKESLAHTQLQVDQAKEAYNKGWSYIMMFYVAAIILGTIAVLWLAWRQRQNQQVLHWQATHDPLTRLANRAAFEYAIQQQLDEPVPSHGSAVLYMDLDKFKYVNDSCGHAAGDELLRQVSRKLESTVRHSDLVARIGGDEFGVLLLGCDLGEATRVAENIRQMVGDFNFIWDNKHFDIGVSIGVALLEQGHESVAQVLKEADVACYAAKDLGRGRVHVYSALDDESSRRITELERINQVRDALKHDGFKLYKQYIKPIQGDAQDHYEILLRLPLADGTVLSPGEFLPAAESYHLITAVDRWVVSHTLDYLEHNDTGNTIYNVNLTGDTLNDEDSLTYILETLRESKVNPGRLCFEITETAAIRDFSSTGSFISELKSLGCSFALDDFGTGLSSFTYLKQLSVDYIKIDGSFVRNILDNSEDQAFVKAIHAVSQVMKIQTVAEWVETQQIMDYLADIGIDFVQGFTIAKPEPI
jgi:diguanylate cyclase (GGDEF)-like protein